MRVFTQQLSVTNVFRWGNLPSYARKVRRDAPYGVGRNLGGGVPPPVLGVGCVERGQFTGADQVHRFDLS
ncbi:hypothetical protein CA54_12230 [Symmachiella macrocystis]|uniref:Uncharacterized protein n=1 Tax=Symmachiella macrocystis TaxID=2527985 RepID=A0A5C6BMS0_9PLAN|nr:hypothetical protein CA54_12230 [Symmachiella macrocystis]